MNYVELTYESMNSRLETIQTECRYETIKLMNNGGDLDELDAILDKWVLAQHKQAMLNSMVERKQNEAPPQQQTIQTEPNAPTQIENG